MTIRRNGATGPVIDRTTPDDVLNLATDSPRSPMQIGAALVFEPGPGFDPVDAADALAARIAAIPRLRQRLRRSPPGCGRPVWVDALDFDPRDHVDVRACPQPCDREALLDTAARLMEEPLDRRRPLWRATLLTGLADGATGLVIRFHHVVTDGIGGLACLAAVVDGAPVTATWTSTSVTPTAIALFADAWSERIGVMSDLRTLLRRLRVTIAGLRASQADPAPRTSLNRPISSRRHYEVVRTDLEPLHAFAHAHGATVNDVILAAIASALSDVLEHRGEAADRFVVSVPVSRRSSAGTMRLGNEVGAVPMLVRSGGSPGERLREIATTSRSAKESASTPDLMVPLARVMAGLHLVRPFLERQHMINTLVTNLRGPADTVTLLGGPVTEVIPLSVVTGNVTVAFAALSYAGALTVTIVADPVTCPDIDVLRDALARRLDELR